MDSKVELRGGSRFQAPRRKDFFRHLFFVLVGQDGDGRDGDGDGVTHVEVVCVVAQNVSSILIYSHCHPPSPRSFVDFFELEGRRERVDLLMDHRTVKIYLHRRPPSVILVA